MIFTATFLYPRHLARLPQASAGILPQAIKERQIPSTFLAEIESGTILVFGDCQSCLLGQRRSRTDLTTKLIERKDRVLPISVSVDKDFCRNVLVSVCVTI